MDAESLDPQRDKFKVTNLKHSCETNEFNSWNQINLENLLYASGKFLVELMQFEHNFTQEFPGN
jgi:lipid-A-disaccharide synthase-like uncharacterized protein